MTKERHISLPPPVLQIIGRLQEAGYEAFAVGGCVRDSILGRTPEDWDITTSARPEEVKALFVRTVDTGLAHGTVTVIQDRIGYEVTTYRIDGLYEDGRHPREVTFTASLREDLRRRDFTVNAMAYNEQVGLIDLYGGLADMEARLLRCVGDARERFGEDALRMLRAVRFSAQLDYEIEEETRRAICSLARTLERISVERVAVEITKLLCSDHPERMLECYQTGLTAVFFPEFDRMMETGQNNPHHCGSVGMHTIRGLQAVKADKTLRLAMLLHDVGKPLSKTTDAEGIDHFYGHGDKGADLARKILRRLRFDNDTTDRVVRLVRVHDNRIEPEAKYLRRAMSRIGADLFPDLLTLKQADLDAQSEYLRSEKQMHLDRLKILYEAVSAQKDCVCLQDLAISGSDLIEAGMRPGPQLGEMLARLLELVIEEPARNNRQWLLEQARLYNEEMMETKKESR